MIEFDRRRLLAFSGVAVLGAGATRALAHDGEHNGDGEGPVPGILAETGAPAMTGGVVTAKGLIHSHTAGLRRNNGTDKVTADDLWHLGSNTKAMTAALYGRLVDKGRARWGATLPELFPDLTLDPAWAKTTVEQLMGHRAGVEERSLIAGGWLMQAHKDTRPIREQRANVAKLILGKPPAGQPGVFAYANFNYVIVGAAIERIVKADWEDAIKTDLFRPLGITTAGYGAPTGAQPWGHRPARTGPQTLPLELVAVDPAGFGDNPAALGPAGRVHISLKDYAKFVRLFLTKGDGVLKPATVEKLSTPVPGEGQAYALGWGVIAGNTAAGGPMLSHDGSNTLWHASTLIAPARGVALIGISNGPPQTTATKRFVKHLQDEFLGTQARVWPSNTVGEGA